MDLLNNQQERHLEVLLTDEEFAGRLLDEIVRNIVLEVARDVEDDRDAIFEGELGEPITLTRFSLDIGCVTPLFRIDSDDCSRSVVVCSEWPKHNGESLKELEGI